MHHTHEERVTFGPFRLAGAQGPLWNGDTVIALAPKALAILWTLVRQAGAVVTKEALFTAVWGDTIVSDGALAVHLRQIRHALGDSASDPQYIETVHRIGYRFIAPLQQGSGVRGQGSVKEVVNESQRVPDPAVLLPIPDPRFPTPVLVGREAELTQLHNLFAKAVNGERQLVFVTGEAGIGKTALIETFVQSLVSSVTERPESRVKPPSKSPHANPRLLTPDPWIAQGQCIEPLEELSNFRFVLNDPMNK